MERALHFVRNMSLRIILALTVATNVAILACGGPDPTTESEALAASCSPSPTPTCAPGYELAQASPSSSPVATRSSGLREAGWVDDFCSFVKWVCRRKQANTPGGQCGEGGAPTACPANACWTDDGGGFCTQYSCAGVADGSAPNASTGWANGTGCQTN